MESHAFFSELDSRIAKYDLLCHPFYKAWSAGELTPEDLREYGKDYYHHVREFPTYLAEFAVRLEENDLRRAVLANLADEKGSADGSGESTPEHAELWLDFVEGMGGRRESRQVPLPEVDALMAHFHRLAAEGSAEEALAAFYAYESQVPRVAQEKDRGLRDLYGAGEKARGYFTLHGTADVYHSQVWRRQLGKLIEANPDAAPAALDAAEQAAQALWHALDGIEARRG